MTLIQKNPSKNAAINEFLIGNQIRIRNNPAISPDMCLNFNQLLNEILAEKEIFKGLKEPGDCSRIAGQLQGLILYPQSRFQISGHWYFLVESRHSGDGAFLTSAQPPENFAAVEEIKEDLFAVPLYWENLIEWKNLVQSENPSSTIFPTAVPPLDNTSIGVGARFTTLHWPGVAWVMKELKLPLTANQNSIPRELVYDVQAMLDDRLTEMPFPFIGGNVPEGHQGQSVQGMTHASIVTYLKNGFHLHKVPWGFNADHQPIGGRFDEIENELVEGCMFASYITYDLSPELSQTSIPKEEKGIESQFQKTVDKLVYETTRKRLSGAGIQVDEKELQKLTLYLTPAMKKLIRRDEMYKTVREKYFKTEVGMHFYKELSIDELPGETTIETLAACLAMAEAMGVKFQYVAPNIGFQKNFPYDDNAELETKSKKLYEVAEKFGVSFGFHSGSGKSGENYAILGRVTSGNLEIKTSGRYTYEMGAALAASSNPEDQKLWKDWYDFTKEMAIEGAFSSDEVRKKFARTFLEHAIGLEGKSVEGVFENKQNLQRVLDSLKPSPDHMFWFEYNFLYVLAADGSFQKLGDHSEEGYKQRARFYGISDEGKLLFAGNVAKYLLFLAEHAALRPAEDVARARKNLEGLKTYQDFLNDIAL